MAVSELFSGFPPPKERLILRAAPYEVEIWPELGGSIAQFDALADGAVLPLFRRTGPQETYQPADLACWPLLPYSNRIARGKFSFDGADYHVAANVPTTPHALHGIGWQSPWRVISASEAQCRLALAHRADARWPFDFTAEQHFVVNQDGLRISTSLTNAGRVAMPCGLGQHPYLPRPRGTKIHADVGGVWLTDDSVLPLRRVETPREWSLRDGCDLDGVAIDNCFEPLAGAVTVAWPAEGALEVAGSENLRCLILFSPPNENFVCVEFVSHVPNAFNMADRLPQSVISSVLQPGETLSVTHAFRWRPPVL